MSHVSTLNHRHKYLYVYAKVIKLLQIIKNREINNTIIIIFKPILLKVNDIILLSQCKHEYSYYSYKYITISRHTVVWYTFYG